MKLKKGVFIFVITISFLASLTLIFAAQHETAQPVVSDIDRAYACLENQLGSNCGNTQNTEQAAFNLLAIAYNQGKQNNCKTDLNQKKQLTCWSETDTGSCNIKSTAIATLALNYIRENVDDQKSWILDRRISGTGLTWFLQVDSDNRTECTINGATVVIEENKQISGTFPSGLERAYDGYWFEITDIARNYTISCDKDFRTALSYQKSGDNIYYISSETQFASAFDSVIEKVESYCLSTTNNCDYESTLWGALALSTMSEDISSLLPYLTSSSSQVENKQYLPSAFLSILTNREEYRSELVSLQKPSNFWDESGRRFFDTALAISALQGFNLNEVDNAKRFLTTVQRDDGCWQSDTAFILHSVWPKQPAISGGGGTTFCIDAGNYCVLDTQCNSTNTLPSTNFVCPSSLQVCCLVEPEQESCADRNGVVCSSDQDCDAPTVPTPEGSCCRANCIDRQIIVNECEQQSSDYNCKTQCTGSEEEKDAFSFSCSVGQACCGPKPPKEKGGNLLLIILIVILIILVILAIIFRNQLKVWLFKMKSGFKAKKSGRPPGRPPGPPMPGRFGPPRRPVPGRRPPAGRPVGRDREFEETMKKLKEMSK